MVIGFTTFLVGLGANVLRPKDIKWFQRLRRPVWLTFEKLIPLIWTIIFVCGAWSAYIIWERNPGNSRSWSLMLFYLLLEIVIVIYPPATLWLHSLKIGTIVGGLGFILGLILTLMVWQISGWAALLLLPYLLWSPIGTYTTWAIYRLNYESNDS
jgi:translocator protein